MATPYQDLLSRGAALVEDADPETVTIAGFPMALPANIGAIYRRTVWTGNGNRLQVRGTLEIRRDKLAELAPGRPDPVSDTELTVRGKVYRVDFTNGDTTTLRVEFASFL